MRENFTSHSSHHAAITELSGRNFAGRNSSPFPPCEQWWSSDHHCYPARASKRRTCFCSPRAKGPGAATRRPLPAGCHPGIDPGSLFCTGLVCSAQADIHMYRHTDVCLSVLGFAFLSGLPVYCGGSVTNAQSTAL